jgi:ketosteroid isomerase-like protein
MEPKEVIERWVEAFNKADADLISSYYSDDAVNHQVANSEVAGKDAIHAMFREEFAAAEMDCIVENLFQDGEWAILEWKETL